MWPRSVAVRSFVRQTEIKLIPMVSNADRRKPTASYQTVPNPAHTVSARVFDTNVEIGFENAANSKQLWATDKEKEKESTDERATRYRIKTFVCDELVSPTKGKILKKFTSLSPYCLFLCVPWSQVKFLITICKCQSKSAKSRKSC